MSDDRCRECPQCAFLQDGISPIARPGSLILWQQYEKHNQLLDAVYDLAKEAVGEEKANAILDKHEVKRLN